ncbi:hypothetical protein L1987_72684 [Smallanthus sonchifolius]|uniref:Uncharacterized protein n=1 Tax=Smallanthus sonchifolius TaxID=185202 RepID=A0ACB9AVH3_9ASTR|nr:hypothetical protein L1987_72684 [Smallanthus sonchifolius]
MVRAPFFDKNGIKKGAWSEDEDNKLRAYIERYGHPNWRQLPNLADRARIDQTTVLKKEQSGSLEPRVANPKGCPLIKNRLNTQQEVEILLAVLSSDHLTPSSSTSESSPCSLSVLDYLVPNDATPKISDTTGNVWIEPFLQDEGSILSSSDNMFSSLGLADDLMFQTSLQDNMIDDVLLWST